MPSVIGKTVFERFVMIYSCRTGPDGPVAEQIRQWKQAPIFHLGYDPSAVLLRR